MGSTEEGPGDYEALVDVIKPGKSLTVDVEPKNSFILRYGTRAIPAAPPRRDLSASAEPAWIPPRPEFEFGFDVFPPIGLSSSSAPAT